MSDQPPWIRSKDDGVLVALQVVPGARVTRIVGPHGDRLRVQVAAPPTEGRANREIESAFAGWSGLSRTCVKIVRGTTSRRKTLAISAASATVAVARLLKAEGA